MVEHEDGITEVLTPLGASVISGRGLEAVRVATVQGHIRTCFVEQFGKYPTRFVELRSVLGYWRGKLSRAWESELESMRYGAPVLELDGERYRILHPRGAGYSVEPTCPHGNEWPCTEMPCSPLWFRWGEK